MVPLGRYHLAHAPGARRRLLAVRPHDAPAQVIDQVEEILGQVPWHDDLAVAAWLVQEPWHGAIAVALLADRPRTLVGERLAALFPELAALAVPQRAVSHEHQAPDPEDEAPAPLCDHVLRALRHGLTDAAALAPPWRALFTTVILFSDVAKGGDAATRADWSTRLGLDGAVHNQDSAVLLDDALRRLLGRAPPFCEDPRWARYATAQVAATGLLGMRLRGEVDRDALAPLVEMFPEEPEGQLRRLWSLVNRCDTAAVREGLWSPALQAAFAAEEQALCAGPLPCPRTPFAERVARLRHGALVTHDDPRIAEVDAALAALGDARACLEARMGGCAVWYAEAALGCLALPAALRLLLLLSGVAEAAGLDLGRRWHLDLLGVVPHLRDAQGRERTYPLRLLATLLDQTAVADLAQGRLGGSGERALVSFPARKGHDAALLVRLDEGEEARALLTLLSIYERKQTAAFHATLKALCDLYGLRKDDFDRVANEDSYLSTMNAARSDKSRMLDYARPGLICEVGPGGGVVLDLLAEHLPQSRVLGIDASAAVVEALGRRQRDEGRRWQVVHGDAFQLPQILESLGAGPASTIVFCSVLHEIFSYVPSGQPPARFRFEGVAALVVAALRALAPGGRVLIRDGFTPPDEPRVVEFLSPVWREGLDLFASSYEARPIRYEPLGPRRVRLSAPDLYEFVTTFTWGPAAFPYEIREQRAVLPRARYAQLLLGAAAAADPPIPAREVPVPADLASYLQPDYPRNILPHLRVYDARGEREVPLPDITGVLVLERGAGGAYDVQAT